MNFIQELVNEALGDAYLQELIEKAEEIYGYYFLKKNSDLSFSTEQYNDILRFADILSRDENSVGRNKAYKIVSLLYPFYKEDDYYIFVANSVMTKLGNFPSLNVMLSKENIGKYDTLETHFEKVVKEEYQKVPCSEYIFTDSQYRLFEKIKDSNHYSFSGPTSFGKSFIMDAFIKHVISERHAVDNICILVPTRALINQVSKRMSREIKNINYYVLTHPEIPMLYRSDEKRYIFVFTPERLIAYLSNKANPSIDYLFVDEAQKIIAQKDSRAPLYYQAISMAERKSIKLFFASPNIPNSDVFLQLFDKSTDESMVVDEAPVAQNKFFIDFVDKTEIMFMESGNDYHFTSFGDYGDLIGVLSKIGSGSKNIVYCSSIEDTIQYARSFAETLPVESIPEIDEVCTMIAEYLHKEYYLIDCLKHRVAFHFGQLPQRVREKIEELYENKYLDWIFCTSTLLEGVNLPSKNIFILNNTIGTRKFTDIDFWNLAGRAGRLNKELSGNIVCVRLTENKWKDKEKVCSMIRTKSISEVVPTVIKGEGNFYLNIVNSLTGKAFSKKNATQTEKDVWNHYANILYYQEIAGADSVLKNKFLKNNPSSAKKILSAICKDNKVREDILEQSTGIKPKYQNRIFDETIIGELAFPKEITEKNCLEILTKISELYKWNLEESGGRRPLLRDNEQLRYYAVLMYSWITSVPLNLMINNLIKYYERKGVIWHNNERVPFVKDNREHINWVINGLISDIESSLRFKIKNYFSNYYLLILSKNDNDVNKAGEDWSTYLEYGTNDSKIIDLQNIGLPRHLAMLVKECYSQYVKYEGEELVGIDKEGLKKEIITKGKDKELDYIELIDCLID